MGNPEPETILQPSLHTMSEYIDMVISEAEARLPDSEELANIRAEFDRDPEGEFVGELCDEALDLLWQAGYANIEANDTLLIMPKGVPLPEEWTE